MQHRRDSQGRLALKDKVRCPRVPGLIRRYLMAGMVLPDGTREATPQGVPQGGPLSPLLANIVLDPLDKELECPSGLPPASNHFPEEENADRMAGAERRQSRGHTFARYADDFIVLVKSANVATRSRKGCANLFL
jgi:RNA-directed DNA polymerase